MSYIALYRKWRPSDFDDIKGQDAIVTTLRNQVEANRIGHAYLFCGTRGTGKTSAAKVFAKAVNCEHPVAGNPCGECRSCKSIAEGTALNVIEMDGASNNGVEHARQLKDSVVYTPADGKYKVYIIDEAHQVSNDAFNALLKTMEEPPSYVIFILATTEPHKVPVTILSRCQRYDFKRISKTTLEERLKEVAGAEGIEIEDRAVEYIATKAEGGMRDALSLFDQCAAFFLGKKITYEMALEVLGAVDTSVFSEFLRSLAARSVTDSINVIDRVITQGRDPVVFTNDFIWHMRNVLLAKTAEDISRIVDVTAENLALIKKEAEAIPEDVLIRFIRVFSELVNNLRYAEQKRVLIEIAVIKICRPQMEKDLDSVNDRLKIIEDLIESGSLTKETYKNATEAIAPKESASEKEIRQKAVEVAKELPKATIDDLKNISSRWNEVCSKMSQMYAACLRTSTLSVRPGDGRLIIQFVDDTVMFLCEDGAFRESLDNAFFEVIGKKVDYELASYKQAKDNGQYYPPTSIFGMEVSVDDSDFSDT
ncbi:MAG: DNA polymerase III subunit gamma/tau [Lachnospiraceae bacterium]|nr:DNA polymerase III subunit gamma/tau [Lachnospiraceae bacterium]